MEVLSQFHAVKEPMAFESQLKEAMPFSQKCFSQA